MHPKTMKFPILPIAAGCLAALFVIPARAQTDSSEDLSQYDNADSLFMHMVQPIRAGGQQTGATLLNEAAAAAEFQKRYPDDPRVWAARIVADRANLSLATMGQGTEDIDAIQTDLTDITNASDAPPDIQKQATAVLRQVAYQKVAAKIRQIRALENTDPGEADAQLAALANDSDPETASAARSEALRIAAMKQPLNLAFTAVDGSQVDLSQMRGTVVLIDFWATWCHPCMMEVPNVVAAYNQLHSSGFEVVGISLDQSREKLLSVTAEKGMVWPQYFDGLGWQNKISTSYGIGSVPTMWLVNKQGMVVDTDGRTDLEDKIQKLLQE